MGTWGTALYSDDLAADLRGDFTDAAGDGLSAASIVDRLAQEYAASVADADEGPVFWLAVADMGWRLGRLDERARLEALAAIDSGRDLARWEDPRDRVKRAAVLTALRARLSSPPPPPKHVPRRVRHATGWQLGEVFALRLKSGRLTLLRVCDFHEEKDGRFAVFELLDWTGDAVPSPAEIQGQAPRRALNPSGTVCLVPVPRRKTDEARLIPTGVVSPPSPTRGAMTFVSWSHLDRILLEVFGLE